MVPRIPNLCTRWSRHFQEPVAFPTRNNSQYHSNRGLDVLKVIPDNLQKKCSSCRYRRSKSVSSLLQALPTQLQQQQQQQQQKQGLVSQQIITSVLGLEKVKRRLKSFRSLKQTIHIVTAFTAGVYHQGCTNSGQIFLSPRHGTCFLSPFWCLKSLGAS